MLQQAQHALFLDTQGTIKMLHLTKEKGQPNRGRSTYLGSDLASAGVRIKPNSTHTACMCLHTLSPPRSKDTTKKSAYCEKGFRSLSAILAEDTSEFDPLS